MGYPPPTPATSNPPHTSATPLISSYSSYPPPPHTLATPPPYSGYPPPPPHTLATPPPILRLPPPPTLRLLPLISSHAPRPQAVLGLSAEYGEWFRGVVTGVKAGADAGAVTVYSLDFGNTCSLSLAEVKPCNSDLAKLSPLAFQATFQVQQLYSFYTPLYSRARYSC